MWRNKEEQDLNSLLKELHKIKDKKHNIEQRNKRMERLLKTLLLKHQRTDDNSMNNHPITVDQLPILFSMPVKKKTSNSHHNLLIIWWYISRLFLYHCKRNVFFILSYKLKEKCRLQKWKFFKFQILFFFKSAHVKIPYFQLL